MQNKSPENIIGPDVNEYRGNINYKVLATQTPYAYARASGSGTGRFRVDKKFLEYVKGFKSVGILSGGYHYAVPSYDLKTADAQCDDFINLLEQAYGKGNYGDLYPVIDVETPIDKSISTDALLDWVDRFRKRFEKKTRRILMLYTGSFFIELYNNFYHSKKGYILANMPLWIAMYTEIPGNPQYPKDQGGWTRWTMWQYTENGSMKGINPPLDLNYGPKNLDYLTQPRKVKNLKAYADKNNIYVTWEKNMDTDLNGYNLFLNAEYVGTVGKDTKDFKIKLDKPFNTNARYEVAIEAFDLGGDFSQERAKVMVADRKEDINEYETLNNNIVQDENYSIGKYESNQKPNYFSPRLKENTMVYYDKDDDLYYYPVRIKHPHEYEPVMERSSNDGLLFKYRLEEENTLEDFTGEEKNLNYENNLDEEIVHNSKKYPDCTDFKKEYSDLEKELDEEYARDYSYKIRNDFSDFQKRKNAYEDYEELYDYEWLTNKSKNRATRKNNYEFDDIQHRHWYENSYDETTNKSKSKKNKHSRKKHKHHR